MIEAGAAVCSVCKGHAEARPELGASMKEFIRGKGVLTYGAKDGARWPWGEKVVREI